jgi:hypothetical protein
MRGMMAAGAPNSASVGACHDRLDSSIRLVRDALVTAAAAAAAAAKQMLEQHNTVFGHTDRVLQEARMCITSSSY